MPKRWFVLPLHEYDTSPEDADAQYETAPKYRDTTGIEGYSGTTMFFDAETYSDLPWAGQTMFVVQVTGTDAGLDTLAGYSDAYGKVEYDITDAEVAAYLNDATGNDYSWAEWESHFLA